MGRTAVAVVSLCLVPALGVVQGGFQPDAWVWAGTLAAWAAALGLVVTDRGGMLHAAWGWPAVAGALLVWTLASTLWSAEWQQSLLEARRTIVYAGVVLAFVVLARSHPTRTIVAATHIALTALLLYALLRYLLGQRHDDPFEGYAISQPLGYANAIGILAAMGMLLALAPAIDGKTAVARGLGAASIPPLALTLTFTGSDASWLALALGLIAAAFLAPRPTLVMRAAALLVLPSAPLVWLGHHSRYAQTAAPRIGGPTLAAAAAGAAVAAAVATVIASRWAPFRGRKRRAGAVAAVAALTVLVAAAAAIAVGGATQPRSSYYHVAWHEYLAHPALGSGAGTFGRYWEDSHLVTRWGGALDAHSLYLETLAELGPVGLLLLLAFLLYPLGRVLASRHTPGVPAAAGAALAFLVHAGLDWDWELPAVVVAGIACLAAAFLADKHERDRPLARPARGGALLFAVALGLAAIAGTASNTKPSATATNSEAPPSGASLKLT